MFNIDDLPVKTIKSKRKTISIELKEDGILVRAPKGMGRQEINAVLYKKSDWIEKHWMTVQKRKQDMENILPYTEADMKAMMEKAKTMIPQRVKYYAPMVGVDYGRITIRNQKTRWGSCSAKGNLNFNCLLMVFPDEVIDSIVVHELCHRKHMNHSTDFYAELERVFPDYRRCEKWLRENGAVHLRRLP